MCVIKENKSIRGYIIRSLLKGHRNSLLCRQLVNIMITDEVIFSTDISKHLDYLYCKGYIEFTNNKVNSYTAYRKDAVLKLTPKGVDLGEKLIEDIGVEIL